MADNLLKIYSWSCIGVARIASLVCGAIFILSFRFSLPDIVDVVQNVRSIGNLVGLVAAGLLLLLSLLPTKTLRHTGVSPPWLLLA